MAYRRVLQGPEGEVRIRRGKGGAPVLEARGHRDLAYGQGWMHAHDRQVQLMLTRLIAQGRLAECLRADAETEKTDAFMRRLGLAFHARQEAADLTGEPLAWLEAYCQGVNRYLDEHVRPLEFLLAGYTPEPWTPADTLLTLKVMSYVGLAQGQQDVEKFLVEALRRGADLDFLKALLSPHLDALEPAAAAAFAELEIAEPFLTRELRALDLLPHIEASNNWVVGPGRSRSGACLHANDPHLEVNRLPAVWYELTARLPDDYQVGISMPGLPGICMGRSRHLSFGFTYGCMDMIDYFVEDTRQGRYRRGRRWKDFDHRHEVVWRKGREPLVVDVWENDLGVLEGDPRPGGRLLLRAWSGLRRGAVDTLGAMHALQTARTVPQAQAWLARVAVSCNWLVADSTGSIGYQQSGILPRRRGSGLVPLPAWDRANHWRGMVDPERLLRVTDPPEGFLATTNDRWQRPGGPLAINLCNGQYRATRIRQLMDREAPLDLEDMKAFQLDVTSAQAVRWMEFLTPLLPRTRAGERLRGWDCRYLVSSEEALWFEVLYTRIMAEFFGPWFGPGTWEVVVEETGLLHDMHVNLDRLFLEEGGRWTRDEAPETMARRLAAEVLADPPAGTWGQTNQVMMRNLFFGGRLPHALGFDVGPVPLPGGRATLNQGRLYRSHGRPTSFVPSWRFVTDLAQDACETALPGGPSDRRFSRWYSSGVAGWLGGEYVRRRGAATEDAP